MTCSDHSAVAEPQAGAGAWHWRALGLIVTAAAAIRLTQFDQALYGDEIWSYVGATQPDIPAVIDWVRSEQEVTPPLYSLLAWASVQAGDPDVLVRLPAMIAGIVTVPLVYLLGVRCFGRNVGLLAAGLAALSPFLIWHSVEARAYAVMIALTLGSTLALMQGTRRGGVWWWLLYAVLSCGVMYSHYTGAFVLIAQLAWCLWYYPAARLPALAANAGAALAFALWIPGVLDDFGSSTQEAYNNIVPFSLVDSIVFTKRLFGHPLNGFESFLGSIGAGVLVFGFAIAAAGAAVFWLGGRPAGAAVPRPRPEAVLIGLVAIAGPVGCVLGSLSGTHMYIPRNFSASVPALIIAISALALSGPRVFRVGSTLLLVAGFAIGTVKMTSDGGQRPAFTEVAAFVDERAEPGDVVLEATPFPVGVAVERPDGSFETSLSVQYAEPHERVDYYQVTDGGREALELAAGGSLFLIGDGTTLAIIRSGLGLAEPPSPQRQVRDGLFELTVEEIPVPASAAT